MTTIIKSSDENVIALPQWLLQQLKLQEGDLEGQIMPLITAQNSPLAHLLGEFLLYLFKAKTLLTLETETVLVTNKNNVVSPRVLGLHPGAMTMTDDFDDPLPDEFWFGEAHETLT